MSCLISKVYRFQKMGNQRCPPSLMGCAQSFFCFGVEVFIKENIIPATGVDAEFFEAF